MQNNYVIEEKSDLKDLIRLQEKVMSDSFHHRDFATFFAVISRNPNMLDEVRIRRLCELAIHLLTTESSDSNPIELLELINEILGIDIK